MTGKVKKLARQDGTTLYRRRTVQPDDPPPEAAPPALGPFEQSVLRSLSAEINITGWTEYSLSILLPHSSGLPKLPPGYFFKGGAARETLRQILFPDGPKFNIRDLDIMRFVETDDNEDHRLALQYMIDDYRFGRGVEVVESPERYFQTRDITSNEVLCRERTIEASFAAAADLRAGVLRPTAYVMDAEGALESRTAMKILRLAAEAVVHNVELELCDFPADTHILPFDLALHLERALAVDESIALEYILLAWKQGLLMPERSSPPLLVEVVRLLGRNLQQGLSFFRHLPMEIIRDLGL